jgi:phosphoribosylanthranilate isomerase
MAAMEHGSEPALSAAGFCGADDSVHVHQLALISQAYPLVEFGVLFRPDREGTPRYASADWVTNLGRTARHMQTSSGHVMKLAAHLCGSRVNDLLEGRGNEFLTYLQQTGFQRVQINATAVNGVDTSRLAESVPVLWNVIQEYTELEFILQKNEETKPLWQGIEELLASKPLDNVAVLLDESKGTGVLSSTWPKPSSLAKTGYAGGIGPDNVSRVVAEIVTVVRSSDDARTFWIDMESSLRSIKNEHDVFDLDKCYEVIRNLRM